MPKITGTRKQRAEALYQRLAAGPMFRADPGVPFTPEEAQRAFRGWVKSWVLPDACDLVPELRDRLTIAGNLDRVRLDAVREVIDSHAPTLRG